MKIKKLSIRNIASIEKGDIDFENGLNDIGSSSPAPLFLISGDTGAGKSVILDCISMCLYGTTPRVEGVNGVKKNRFTASDGSELSVSDIEQYTRLGITAKDECYARLEFEGNDGVIYISTYRLGRTTHGNYASPRWILRIGEETVLEKKKNVAPVILDAIGLSYEQFSRMAMLAQGQFASFLTGGKDERERILEQLTSTELFSRYGQAIERIYKRHKKEKERLELSIASEKAHLLPDEEEITLNKSVDEAEGILSDLRGKLNIVNERIRIIGEIAKTSTSVENVKAQLKSIEEERSCREFKDMVKSVAQWDSTSSVRTLFVRKIEMEKVLTNYILKYKDALDRRSAIMVLFDKKKLSLQTAHDKVAVLEEELRTMENLRSIFEGKDLIIERLSGFNDLVGSLSSLRKAISTKRHESGISLKESADAEKHLATERSENEEMGRMLESMRVSQEEIVGDLGITGMRSALKMLDDRRHALENIDREVRSYNEEKKVAEEFKLICDKLEQSLKDKRNHLVTIEMKLKKAKTESEKADERYATMHLSVEKGFRDLRNRLRTEHAAICPLCGQGVEDPDKHWTNEETAYMEMLSPLWIEKEETAALLKDAQHEYDELKSVIKTDEGKLESIGTQLKVDLIKLRNLKDKILTSLPEYEIESIESAGIAIKHNLKENNLEADRYRKKIFMFDRLAGKINEIQKRKDKSDKTVEKLTEAFHKIENLCSQHSLEIAGLEQNIRDIITAIRHKKNELSKDLQEYRPDWYSNIRATCGQLNAEADKFFSIEAKIRENKESLRASEDLLCRVAEQSALLTQSLPQDISYEPDLSITSAEIASDVTDREFEKMWTDLYAEIKGLIADIIDSRKSMEELKSSLEEKYKATSTDEETLTALLAIEPHIPEMRKIIADSENVRSIIIHRLENYNKLLCDLNHQLEESAPIEESELTGLKENLESAIEEKLKSIGSLRTRLDANQQLRKEYTSLLSDAEKQRETFVKWEKINRLFGGTRFRTLVQSYILRPLLRSANLYLERITDHYTLTCSDDNEQLSILVLDRYNKNQVRSATVLSGGERFMISLALSLALSSLNKPDMNVDILFIDEGFGTLDSGSLNAVIDTLRRLPEIAGGNGRRVGVISHREELADEIEVKVNVVKCGEGRSRIEVSGG